MPVTGSEMLDEAAAEPSLDRYLDNVPNKVNIPELVSQLRKKRVWNINAKEKKTKDEQEV